VVTHSVINRIEIERAPSFAEWVNAACGAFPAREYELLLLNNPLSTDPTLERAPISQSDEVALAGSHLLQTATPPHHQPER
jgi:hypothetical protein